MKTLALFLFIISIIAFPSKLFSQAVIADSMQINKPVKTEKTTEEKLNLILSYIANNVESNEYYKMYPTTNIWTFIKLDTRTGKLWQVQFGLEDKYRFESPINLSDLTYDGGKALRFELYPTKNTYNFLLLDQTTGRVWQMQWSMDEEQRHIIRIY